jgi:hypothetical protein
MLTPSLGVALFAAILFVCLRFVFTSPNYAWKPPEEVEIAWRKLSLLPPGTIRRWDEKNREFYIDGTLWQKLPGAVREDFGRAMAAAMSASRVDVCDWQSGKRIGRFTVGTHSFELGEER